MKPTTVDAYLVTFAPEVQALLAQVRAMIHEQAPDAAESMAYGMPAYKLNGKPLVYFAAYPNHIGLYATPNAHAAFAEALAGYKQGKGSVQFPISEPLPLALMARMVAHRAAELTPGDLE